MIRQFSLLLLLVVIGALSACKKDDPGADPGDLTGIPYNPTLYPLVIPQGLPPMDIPQDNPLTEEGIQLGRYLFYDPILSRDSSQACASCHMPQGSFTDNKAFSTGIRGLLGKRSSMGLLNVGYYTTGLFWDGRVNTLEEQALKPVEDHLEMDDTWDNVELKLRRHKDYPARFRKAFGIKNSQEITRDLAVKAIAQFERTLISANSRYDRVFVRGEEPPTDEEALGYDLFFDISPDIKDGQCGHCHGGPLLTANTYFNNGLDSVNTLMDFTDPGRGAVTGKMLDYGKFRATTLRNIELTAPYMHDGRFKTLEEVLEHYGEHIRKEDNLDANLINLKLTKQEKAAILAFMLTLTDTSFVKNPAFQNPF